MANTPAVGHWTGARANPQAGFLHDGRARTLEEAVLWHGGEATTAAERYRKMSSGDRSALIDFLNSL